MSQNVFNLVPRAIFPPFSYSEKMRWRRGWNILSSANFYCKTGLLLKHRKRVIWKSVFVWQNDTNIFYLLPKVWSTLHHGSVWPVHKKKCYLMLLCTFFGIFLFFIMKFIFIIFIFLEQVSNFRKRELVVSNCQWNCVHYKQQKTLKSSFILRKIVYFFYQNPQLFCFIDSSSWVRVEIGLLMHLSMHGQQEQLLWMNFQQPVYFFANILVNRRYFFCCAKQGSCVTLALDTYWWKSPVT